MAEPLLELAAISMQFGGLRVIDSLDLAVQPGEVRSIIGPNGAGKTTVFNIITGAYTPTEGQVRFAGQALGRQRADQRVHLGMSRTFQNIRLFANLTLLENVLIGAHSRGKGGLLAAVTRPGWAKREERELRELAQRQMEFVGLSHLGGQLASGLPYGAQRRVEIARALAAEPRLLLLDEPTAGMNSQETTEVMALVRKVRESGVTVLLIAHDMRVVIGVSDRVTVLNHGCKIAEGTAREVHEHPAVIEAYLGGQADASGI